jgi:hypothetical protein
MLDNTTKKGPSYEANISLKVKISLSTPLRYTRGEVQLHTFLPSAVHGGK